VPSLPLPNRVQAAAGDLDPTFGSGGKVFTPFPGNSGTQDVVIQSDNKIVAVGISGAGFALARYNVDGNLDQTFGVGGKVITQFPGFLLGANAVALLSNGKILVAGLSVDSQTSGLDFAIARYNTDGSLDTTFGNGGSVGTDFIGGFAQAFDIEIQPDGKIVAVGVVSKINDGSTQDFALARYNPDGSLDTTFGSGGKVITDIFNFVDTANALKIQSDGKIVVAGSARHSTGGRSFVLIRYNADGSFDSTFGVGGKVFAGFGDFDEAKDLSIQPDGKIVATGATNSGAAIEVAVARYNSDGDLDTTFGIGGKVTTNFFGNDAAANAMIIRPDGKILATGIVRIGARVDLALFQYNPNGGLDTSFGTNGIVNTSFTGRLDIGNAVALQSDGKIIAAGAGVAVGSEQFILARYGDGIIFDICTQDDSNGNTFRFNTATGEYQFTNCSGLAVGGIGILTRKGCTLTLQHNTGDRKVLAKIDTCQKKATASVQLISQGRTFTITDRNTANNTCTCGN
jgi:uncharacterized delta-60 repeat protein